MSLLRRMTEAYAFAINEDWISLKEFFEENTDFMAFPMTVNNDTVLHMAVYSKSKTLYGDLIKLALESLNSERPFLGNPFAKANDYGDTALHEAAAAGNIGAAKLLLDNRIKLLKQRNQLGETPLFKAAAYGQTRMVKFLARKVNNKRAPIFRRDKTSILHIAICGGHFETALWLKRYYKDKSFEKLEVAQQMTCLQVLANMPLAFKSGYSMGILKRLLYNCLPEYCDMEDDGDDDDAQLPQTQPDDLEAGRGKTLLPHRGFDYSISLTVISKKYHDFWRFLARGWLMLDTLWNDKRSHVSALKLAKLLVEEDTSWESTYTVPDWGISAGEESQNPDRNSLKEGGPLAPPPPTPNLKKETSPPTLSSFTPLIIATRKGITEIVKEILKIYPQAVEHISIEGMTILHEAIQHRQLEIFRRVRNMEIPKAKLVRKRDRRYNTILHCASNYNKGTRPGPALQLQDELHWFERVRKIIPPHYITLENEDSKTAEDLFTKNHEELLQDARKWLKETSQSCSAVAVLVATVVFAAAYTAPGGSDNAGRPVLGRSAFFLVFTITDIISLACSLTSVVMFLSVLTSPLRLKDFYSSLPRKLMLGFTLLFLSISTTMLTFTATILLIIHLKKSWTTTLIYAVAFLPVTVFALLQFPLYVAFIDTLKYVRTLIRHILPLNFIRYLNPKYVFPVIKRPFFCFNSI